jgi:GNAT superfamily N-acetyltransferase
VFLVTDLVPVSGLDTDPEGVARFDAWTQVLVDVARHEQGDDHDAWSAAELRGLEGSPTKKRVQVMALEEGRPVGGAWLIAPVLDNQHVAWVSVAVLPPHRRRGIGDLLARWVEEQARGLGRTTLQGETDWVAGGAVDPHAGWVERNGFAPAQTVVRSDLEVGAGDLPVVSAADGYRVETHVDEMPEADLEDRAVLARRMSTDVPLGDLVLHEEEWDAERVRGEDERTRSIGRRVVSSFARDLASGHLVGYTSIQVPRDAPELAFQEDTLVMREHRGHGLGLALKAANLEVLAREVPVVRRVRTWNAVENAHMIAVNTALGYRPSGYLREWQKHLT